MVLQGCMEELYPEELCTEARFFIDNNQALLQHQYVPVRALVPYGTKAWYRTYMLRIAALQGFLTLS